MLGNQYFLARRFKDATNQFEKSLLIDPTNNNVKKKLIICYLQTNEMRMALQIFTDLISNNLEIILNSDSSRDDCPCRQMIFELENFPSKLEEVEKNTALGILWLYCDALNSQKYFYKLLKVDPNNPIYLKITDLLNQSFHRNHGVKQDEQKRNIS